MHALNVNSISFSYSSTVPTLRDVSFHVQKGEFFSLAGPNGSGKSTLLRILNRILIPSEGTVALDGRDITAFARGELARHIALVPQDTTMQFPFTAMEIVLMGRSPHVRGRMFESERDRAIAAEMMKQTDTSHLAHQPVTTLSGGERQRVFIARALAQEPEILLLDEPNAHLDIAHQVEIFAILKRLNSERGLTVVSVSHDLNLAAAYSDRIGMLVCGSLIAVGTPEEVLTAGNIHNAFRARVLVDRNPATHAPRISLLPTHSA